MTKIATELADGRHKNYQTHLHLIHMSNINFAFALNLNSFTRFKCAGRINQCHVDVGILKLALCHSIRTCFHIRLLFTIDTGETLLAVAFIRQEIVDASSSIDARKKGAIVKLGCCKNR